MSNLLFTPASLSQQETAFGGMKTPIVVKAPVIVNLNFALPLIFGSKNVTEINQGIKNK